jgi:tRNA-dihydrouridine synthase B
MQIGCYTLSNPYLLAPMAGITDRPFRTLCKNYGAALAFSEMVASQPHLQQHRRTLKKTDYQDEPGLRAVQILGTEPKQMAEAAKTNVERGADIIDINMGCPAKKVCSVAAGSALLRDEKRVASILEAVVSAVEVPVTLKIRTGWDKQHKNALTIAKIAQNSGIAALTIHGRTRACKFTGHAEYDTIRQVKETVKLPIIANGDIDSPEKADQVMAYTRADAVMIGRAAQGKPWIFKQLQQHNSTPDITEIQTVLNIHLESLYSFYGNISGVRIARKHIGWYFDHLGKLPATWKKQINQAQNPDQQRDLVNQSFNFFSQQNPV